jgi:hypothetical protein
MIARSSIRRTGHGPGTGQETPHEIINKSYIFVNNQFIPNGIGIAKL